jgi:hypothetical protein
MAKVYAKQAFESEPGNETNSPTPSTKVIYPPMQAIELALNPSHLERDDEARYVDEPLEVLPERYAPTWSLRTRAYPDITGFELKNILGAPVTTAGDGTITDPDGNPIPSGAHRHVWAAPYGPAGVSPLTKEIVGAWEAHGFWARAAGCASQELAIETPETGGAMLTSSGPALFMEKIADPSLSPAFESLAIPPFQRGDLQIVTWLGDTARTEDFSVRIANPVEAISTLAAASRFPDVMEKGDAPIVVSGSIPKRAIAGADWDALVNATRFAVKVRWESKVVIGATTYRYTLWLECDGAQYLAGGPNAIENKRRIGASFDWKATFDGSGASSKWTLVNSVSSYS